jgi:hypothetical protein
MSSIQNKEAVVKALIVQKYSNEILSTGEFKLDPLINQLADNSLEYILIGDYVVPKSNILSIKLV